MVTARSGIFTTVHSMSRLTSLCWQPCSGKELGKMLSCYVIMLQPIQKALLIMFFSVLGGKCYNSLPNSTNSLFHVHSVRRNKTMIQNACSLLVSSQWVLYIYPHLMVTFTSTCHMLSNDYAPFLMLPHFWPRRKRLQWLTEWLS
jgi:hypothetical protein